VNYTYQPKINLGVLSVWPLPDSTAASTYTLELTYNRPLEGFTAAGETPDFPQDWQNVLIFGLAWTMAGEWGVPTEDRKMLKSDFEWHLEAVTEGEDSSIYFQREDR
jgi:hypothetical protein